MKDTKNQPITKKEFMQEETTVGETPKLGLCLGCNTMKNLSVGKLCGRCYFDLPKTKITMPKTNIVNLKTSSPKPSPLKHR